MIGLDAVVGIPFHVVPRRRDQLVEHPRIDGRRVGDHLRWCHLQRGQRPAEEPAGSIPVATLRYEHVDDLPVLVDGPIDVTPYALDLDAGRIHEPPVTGRVPAEPSRIGQQRYKPLYPAVDRDVIDLHTALSQQLLDVPVGQAVPQIPAHRHDDHVSRETETRNAERDAGRAGELRASPSHPARSTID